MAPESCTGSDYCKPSNQTRWTADADRAARWLTPMTRLSYPSYAQAQWSQSCCIATLPSQPPR